MDGVLIIDKPKGITSHDVVLRVKRAICAKKVGHIGTLDPMATGVLPLCINRATKIVRYLEGGRKEYIARIQLGIETDSYDAYGKITHKNDTNHITEGDVKEAVSLFVGKIRQLPPMFSAVKVDGIPLYRYARRGITVPRRYKEVETFSIDIEENSIPYLTIKVACSGGTYIRTLAHDIGKELGCGAHLIALKRIRNGMFSLDDSMSLNERSDELLKRLIPLSELMRELTGVTGQVIGLQNRGGDLVC